MGRKDAIGKSSSIPPQIPVEEDFTNGIMQILQETLDQTKKSH